MTPDPMTPRTTSFPVALARVFWMMVGPMALVVLLIGILTKGSGWFTLTDFAFFTVLGGMLLARVIEFRGGNPLTDLGEPATPAHLRRYVIATLVVGLGVWVLANLIGNHWVPR